MSNRVSKPSNTDRGRKKTEKDWNDQYYRILHLWLKDGGEGRRLDEIVEIMKKKHGFRATATQYHNRLVKKWNVRKRIKKDEWRKLFWNEKDRRQAGQSCEVLFYGRPLLPETKAREWYRYDFASESRPNGN